jgi:branched-subunit amino acid ABC-type transport system permease component
VTDFLHAVGFGLVTASILALATVAISLQFSVTSIPNLAQGEFMMMGAYGGLVVQSVIQNVIVEALAAVVVGAAVSWAVYRFLLQPFVRAGTRNTTLLVVTLGVSLILQNVLLAVFGGSYLQLKVPASAPITVGPFLWTIADVIIIVAALVSLSVVHIVLRYTKFGKSQRAVADNPELARVTGINSGQVIRLTWLWAGAMSGLGGFVLGAQIGGLEPSLGFQFLLVVFAAAVVGGIGQPYGAMLGALLIGIAMEVSAAYIPADYKQGVAFAALILTLLFRPNGLVPSRSRIVAEA